MREGHGAVIFFDCPYIFLMIWILRKLKNASQTL